MRGLVGIVLGMFVGFSGVRLAAQPPAPPVLEPPSAEAVAPTRRTSSWRDAIAKRMSVAPESLILNMPPVGEPLLGAVILYHPEAGTYEVIGRLGKSHYQVQQDAKFLLGGVKDGRRLPRDSTVLNRLFDKLALEDEAKDVAMMMVAHDISAEHLLISDSRSVAADLDKIFESWKEAHPAKTRTSDSNEPILVKTVYKGDLQLAFRGLQALGCEAIKSFELFSDDEVVELYSRETVEFAFSGQSIYDTRPRSQAVAPAPPPPLTPDMLPPLPPSTDPSTSPGPKPSAPSAPSTPPAPKASYQVVQPNIHYHSANLSRMHSVEYERAEELAVAEAPALDSIAEVVDDVPLEMASSAAPDPPQTLATDPPLAPEDPLVAEAVASEIPKVTVPYATCRQVRHKTTPWRRLVLGFFGKTNGLLTLAVGAVFSLFFWLVLGFMKSLTLKRCAGTMLVLAAICLVVAIVDASNTAREERAVTGVYNNLRGALSYGLAEVHVPEAHQRGKMESPFSVYVFKASENKDKHFVVTQVTENEGNFLRNLKRRVNASPEKQAFIFIHGYNVSFADAVKRTAQLHLDLNFQGAPICFSWPSQADLIHYLSDDTTAQVVAFRLKELLLKLEEESGAERIHLIAHSMGNKVLGLAMKEIGVEHLAQTNKFDTVVLTAPDIDVEVFEQQILPAMQREKRHITLYASKQDRALIASAALRNYRRLGDASKLFVHPSMETVDVSSIDTDFLGHSYYGDHLLVVDDMSHVLLGERASTRHLQQGTDSNGLPYWSIPVGTPE